MRLIKPSATILSITPNALKLIEAAGRTCYKSEDKITITSAGQFVQMILKRGHDSVLEHASATVRFICDRGVSHEIVRHRIASYSQESTRYCDYNGGHIEFIIPPWCAVALGEYDADWDDIGADSQWMSSMWDAEQRYRALRAAGWKPEQARSVLPNSLKTEIVMTANLREWRHFFKLRTAPAAHPQMRELTIPLLAEFQRQVPVIFDDILSAPVTEHKCEAVQMSDQMHCKRCNLTWDMNDSHPPVCEMLRHPPLPVKQTSCADYNAETCPLRFTCKLPVCVGAAPRRRATDQQWPPATPSAP